MDCNLARRLLPYDRPGGSDLEAADRAALGHHLESCPGCAAAGRAERAFDTALARSMRAVPVPDGFAVRLNSRLLAARFAFFRRIFLLGFLVIAILGGSLLAWSAWRKPELNAALLAQQTYELNGQSRTNDEARAAATDWLRQFDSRPFFPPTLVAPDDLNYKYLAFAQRSDFQGLSAVPTLVFARNDATMRVYVVREGVFRNLGEVREDAGGCTIEARRYESMKGWVFIVVTSGAPPEAFRQVDRPLDPA
jgi:hypothetical protein